MKKDNSKIKQNSKKFKDKYNIIKWFTKEVYQNLSIDTIIILFLLCIYIFLLTLINKI